MSDSGQLPSRIPALDGVGELRERLDARAVGFRIQSAPHRADTPGDPRPGRPRHPRGTDRRRESWSRVRAAAFERNARRNADPASRPLPRASRACNRRRPASVSRSNSTRSLPFAFETIVSSGRARAARASAGNDIRRHQLPEIRSWWYACNSASAASTAGSRHTRMVENQVEVQPASARVVGRLDRRADVDRALGESFSAGERGGIDHRRRAAARRAADPGPVREDEDAAGIEKNVSSTSSRAARSVAHVSFSVTVRLKTSRPGVESGSTQK